MEVKNASDVKLNRSQSEKTIRYKKKKEMMDKEIENGNAESKEEKGTCLEAENVRLGLGAEQSSISRKKRKKMNENNSLVDEKKSDSFLKEEVNSLTNTSGNAGSEPGPKEGPAGSETKRKRKKKKKKEMNAESVLELKDKQENRLTDEIKVSDSHMEISKNLGVLENLPGLLGTQLNESDTKRKKMNVNNSLDVEKKTDSFLKEEANSLTNTPGNASSEPGLKEGPAGSETKRKRRKKKKKKVQMNAESVLELKDKQENPLTDEIKVSDSNMEISKNLGVLENLPGLLGTQLNEPETKRKKMNGNNSLDDEKKTDSFLKEEANSLTNNLGNAGSEPGPKKGPPGSETKRKRKKKKKKMQMNVESVLELKDKQENPLIDQNKASDPHLEISENLGSLENLPGLVGDQLNESETKRKKKRKRNKTKIGAIEDEDTSSKTNVKDDTEAGNKVLSVSEAVESKETNVTGTESDLKGRKEKKRKKSNELVVPINCISLPTPKKLLVLDLNGILVDVVQVTQNLKVKPYTIVNGKGVFKRPFCDEFLDFCFRTFDVGIWSSRLLKNVNSVVDCLMGKELKHKLLFCWCRKMCTITEFNTLENEEKPLVLKELKKIWDNCIPGLPWKKGRYNESNTLLLDDSPYKALRNPANTAIFPHVYQYTDAEDCSLGSGGDIRRYLERLAAAENVQKFVEQNPFGLPAITEAHPRWDFYSQV